jgi:hypothetical protein
MPDTSGPAFCEPFATYDPDSSCWRTSQGTFPWASDEYSETWPKSGTWDLGHAYERPTLAPPTDATASSSLPTLPTPSAADGMGGPGHQGRDGGLNLRTAAALLPSPSAGQHNYDEDPDQWLARRDRLKAKGINGNGAGTPLGVAVKLLPTPRAQDGAGPENHGRTWSGTDFNLHNWARQQRSAPTSRPSTDGPPSSDDHLLPLSTIDD